MEKNYYSSRHYSKAFVQSYRVVSWPKNRSLKDFIPFCAYFVHAIDGRNSLAGGGKSFVRELSYHKTQAWRQHFYWCQCRSSRCARSLNSLLEECPTSLVMAVSGASTAGKHHTPCRPMPYISGKESRINYSGGGEGGRGLPHQTSQLIALS